MERVREDSEGPVGLTAAMERAAPFAIQIDFLPFCCLRPAQLSLGLQPVRLVFAGGATLLLPDEVGTHRNGLWVQIRGGTVRLGLVCNGFALLHWTPPVWVGVILTWGSAPWGRSCNPARSVSGSNLQRQRPAPSISLQADGGEAGHCTGVAVCGELFLWVARLPTGSWKRWTSAPSPVHSKLPRSPCRDSHGCALPVRPAR